MRRNLAGLIGLSVLVIAAGAGLGLTGHLATAQAVADVTVTFSVTCSGNRVDFSIDTWSAVVPQGGTIDWVLTDSSSATSFVIRPKLPGAAGWPFPAASHGGGRGRDNAARGRDMRPDQVGRSFGYDIELTCSDGSVSHEVVIDPRMGVGGP